MLCVVAPVLHTYVYPAGALNTTLSPKQNVVEPLALTLATGKALTTTDVALLWDVQPAALVTVTV